MQFEIKGSRLLRPFSIIYGGNVTPGIATLYDNRVLIKVQKVSKSLSVYGTNGKVHIVASTTVLKTTDDIQFIMWGRSLPEMVKDFKEDIICFNVNPPTCLIQIKGYNHQINIKDEVENYPEPRDFDLDGAPSIKVKPFKKALRDVIKFCCTDPTLPEKQGVEIDCRGLKSAGNTIRAVNLPSDIQRMVLTNYSAHQLLRLLLKTGLSKGGKVRVRRFDEELVFEFSDIVFYTKKRAGPDYLNFSFE